MLTRRARPSRRYSRERRPASARAGARTALLPTNSHLAHYVTPSALGARSGVAGGHMWVKAVSAALPMLTLNPTSGVDLDNAGDFLKNGASSVGLVAPLFPPDAVLGGKWDVIEANARKVIGNVKAALA